MVSLRLIIVLMLGLPANKRNVIYGQSSKVNYFKQKGKCCLNLTTKASVTAYYTEEFLNYLTGCHDGISLISNLTVKL